MDNLEQVVLGSGDLYIDTFVAGTELPANSAIEVDAKLIGRIQGGATVEYKPTTYTVKDDSGAINRSFITGESVKFKSGILTWCLTTLAKLVAAGTYTTDTTTTPPTRKLVIGGKAGRAIQQHVLHFVHTKADGKKIRTTIVGSSDNGFTLAYKPDKETVVDAEFTAASHNSDGNLLVIEEEYTAST